MLATEAHASPSASHEDSPTSMPQCEPEEEEDDWVIVKKQRITILVPQASPPHAQTTGPQTDSIRTKSRRVKRSSDALKKRRCNLSKSEPEKPSATPVPADDTSVDGIQIWSGIRDADHNPVAPHDKLQQLPPFYAYDDGRSIPHQSKTKTIGCGSRLLPIGALRVVNKNLRALNLERRLRKLGGLSRWLSSQGLDQFITSFEKEKLGKYQLVNLTMSKLKDMGTDAVGPRRKLIHAIDCLCQPYYFRAS